MKKSIKGLACALFAFLFTFFVITGCTPNQNQNNGNGNDSVKVNGNENLSANKFEYLSGEEVYVKAKGEGDAWVGVYRENEDINSIDSIRWYYVARDGYTSDKTYGLQHSAIYNETRQAFRNFPAGNYKIILFGDNSKSNVKETVKIKVSKTKIGLPEAPFKVEYTLKNLTDGLADGQLKIYFDDFIATEVVAYWADDEGVLSNYTSLAPFTVTKNPATFEMYENTVIPTEATKLRVYAKNSAGLSVNYFDYDLPKGCQYNFDGNVLSEFQAVSDVHVAVADTHLASADAKTLHDEHFLKMANDIVANSPNSDGIFVVGDIANSGRKVEWEHTKELMDGVPNLPNMYFSLGNHDLYGSESFDTLVQNFYDFAKTDKVYYEKTINGYHHVFLGSESKASGVDADLSQAQLDWFDRKLAEITQKEPYKPVFVYLHQSLYNTIAGSFPGQGWDGIMQEDAFKNIVKKYPQIHMFNGHSHWDLNTRGSMHGRTKELPNIFNTASVAYLWSSFYIPTGEYMRGSQGYYVKVYADKVLVLGRDFVNGKWIPSACFEARI